ncbi:MAG: carboxypeptidase regulatory-like domain-containing protein, partial [Acidobacteria bacterium]|nr:carboxypeptidase regulatory-like domain-containing protein [Acidobacteriota bacterium]
KPPRWNPPEVFPLDFGPIEGGEEDDQKPPDEDGPVRPSIPAALVIPNSLGVLHQFFAVTLQVANGAPAGSGIVLDSITATLKNPPELRVTKSEPAAAFGKPIQITDPNTGATFLLAQASGKIDWTVEGLRTGTHTLNVEVNATYKKNASDQGTALKATVAQSVVVHDARFNITFSHPDTVREGIDYSTFSFITNLSSVKQTLRVQPLVPPCSRVGSATTCQLDDNVTALPFCNGDPQVTLCRLPGEDLIQEVTLAAGETRAIEYQLRPTLTGSVFATAGSVDGDAINAQVQLTMGVSRTGIPLSGATLVMPYYAQFLQQSFVNDYLQILGLGYSLATAPMTQTTANQPSVIKSDVFLRAVDISRAGQRVFIGEDPRDTYPTLMLDLLGNGKNNDLSEWDELRRREKSGRTGGAALARQLERSSLPNAASFDDFLGHFGSVTAWRTPFVAALAHGAPVAGNARPYAVSIHALTQGGKVEVPNETPSATGLLRTLPYGDLDTLNAIDASHTGELAVVGRANENLVALVKPVAGASFTFDLLYPSTQTAQLRRATFNVTNASGKLLHVVLDPTNATLYLIDENQQEVAHVTPTTLDPQPLAVVGARQDLNLDPEAMKVSVLFNRPFGTNVNADLRTLFDGEVTFDQNATNVHYRGKRGVDSAAKQTDGRTVNLTFDHVLSTNAHYSVTTGTFVDPVGGHNVSLAPFSITLDNNRTAGVIYGHVLLADNSVVRQAQVILTSKRWKPIEVGAEEDIVTTFDQYDTSNDQGEFFFEYVLRDGIRSGGTYHLAAVDTNGRTTALDGAVRLTGIAELVNLVYLGRGAAEGTVTYEDGSPVANADVTAGSTMFNQFRTGKTDAAGHYRIDDIPVGPLTFSAVDEKGNVTYAATEIRTPGEVIRQDLQILRKPFPGLGKVRGVVVRSDNGQPVVGAGVRVFSQGYSYLEAITGTDGRFSFAKVPAGLVTLLVAAFEVAPDSVSNDFELAADETRDLTVVLNVSDESTVTVEGDVLAEDPLFAGDPAHYRKVAGALVQVAATQPVTADTNGHYLVTGVPRRHSAGIIRVVDPSTKRLTTAQLPTFPAGQDHYDVPVLIKAGDFGKGTIRARVIDAGGRPVNGINVFARGFPPKPFASKGGGVYELKDVAVNSVVPVWAVSDGTGPYGWQTAHENATVAFDAQTTVVTLRLPGEGKVRVGLYADLLSIGEAALVFPAWDDVSQHLEPMTLTLSTRDPNTGFATYATFEHIPVGNVTAYTTLTGLGFDSKDDAIHYDGEIRTIDLHAAKLSTVEGVVYGIDGRTPLPGALLHFQDGSATRPQEVTKPDGSFKFFNVAGGAGWDLQVETNAGGIYRVGRTSGVTPADGGPVRGADVVLKEQGVVEGRIVYHDYKVFDPFEPSKNVLDDTPNDPSDNAPVPLAFFYLRELEYPFRTFGTAEAPLQADINGRFVLNNIFAGALRMTSWSPNNIDLRGDWQGTLQHEGDTVQAVAAIGGNGIGTIDVTVVDPNNDNHPVLNAEVSLLTGSALYDLQSSDINGNVRFLQVPVGVYSVGAYSKAVGNSGQVDGVAVQRFGIATARVVLLFSGKVTGTLTDPDRGGAGVSAMPITLTATNYSSRTSTDVAGHFLFKGIREGLFKLDALDAATGRRAHAERLLTQADREPVVDLELEPVATLYVKAVLPQDDGSASNVELPVANVKVGQRCREFAREDCDYIRIQQGKGLSYANMYLDSFVGLVNEIGGEGREVPFAGVISRTGVGSSPANPFVVKMPAFGNVEVEVVQPTAENPNAPAVGARVNVYSSPGGSVKVVTDAQGKAIARGLLVGADISADAISLDERTTAWAAGSRLVSIANPAHVRLVLDAYAGLTGKVLAEAGLATPSAGTYVLARFGNLVSKTITDDAGVYRIYGIPITGSTSTTVSLELYGPDGFTVGKRVTVVVEPEWISRLKPVDPVKLDATPPTVVSITPANNAANVPPDTSIRIVFSEKIPDDRIRKENFRLTALEDNQLVPVTFRREFGEGGTYIVTMIPPPATAPAFPLKSNAVYRITLTADIADETGNAMAQRGFNFQTADYAAPKVIAVDPPLAQPLSAGPTIKLTFNKPINDSLLGSHTEVHLYKTATKGGAIVGEVPGTVRADDLKVSLYFTPTQLLEPESFYRLALTGLRDTVTPTPNESEPIHFDFASFDQTAPVILAHIEPTVDEGTSLVAGIGYTIVTDIRNGSATGTPATDIQEVLFMNADGVAFLKLTKPPFNNFFVAPLVTTTGTQKTILIKAIDTSLNESAVVTITRDVIPNQPPQNLRMTLANAPPIYAGSPIHLVPSFSDEGYRVTLHAQLHGINDAGDAVHGVEQTIVATRNKTADPWTFDPPAFDLVVPSTLKETSEARVTINAADGVNAVVNGEETRLTVAADNVQPTIQSITTNPISPLANGAHYKLSASVKDLESGVQQVTFSVNGNVVDTFRYDDARITIASDGALQMTTGEIIVPPVNDDTDIPVTVTARDFKNNVATKTINIVYTGVHDATAPRADWANPLANAIWPASQTAFKTKLRVYATDDEGVTQVKFLVPGLGPITVPATDPQHQTVFETEVTLNTPAAGSTLTLTAVVSDANPAHDQTIAIPVAFVAVDPTKILAGPGLIRPIDSASDSLFNSTVMIRGPDAHLVLNIPVTFENLIVLDGATVEVQKSLLNVERKLDLTVKGTLYVDSDSNINVTGTGYLGGWQFESNGSGHRNEDSRGRTFGNTVEGGPTAGAAASHGGLGSRAELAQFRFFGTPNAVYGSITAPNALGTGGSGSSNGNVAGGQGGGAAALRGSNAAGDPGRIVIAGGVRADGLTGGNSLNNIHAVDAARAGSGGSVLLDGKSVGIGPLAQITANGADEALWENDRNGAGGGRVSVVASERLDFDPRTHNLQARGGRNVVDSEARVFQDGGAGTV